MRCPFIIAITEGETDLKQRLQQTREGIHKEKLQRLWWLKSRQVSQQQESGQRLGREHFTVTRWLPKYRRGGLVALLQSNKAPGNERKIKGAVLADLRQQLQNPAGFSSDGAIVEWLEHKHGLTVEYGTV
jgi:hypothetical protein